ncbi:transposase [Rhizobium sp. 007]|uniref:transposase n=1 Tax=Rhizobium sp. 007 TaxID=2785056 RepID=UPI00188DE347|nr:transposase [Rhizobium sp. 007]QPB24746.1 transposase [Rhizobium sp. 007]
MLTTSRDSLTKSETVTIAAIESGVPRLVVARDIIADFHIMIRRKAECQLNPWIDRARDSLVASFGNGVAKDMQADRAAIVSSWSSGQTEGPITKLKLVKRQWRRNARRSSSPDKVPHEQGAPTLRQSQPSVPIQMFSEFHPLRGPDPRRSEPCPRSSFSHKINDLKRFAFCDSGFSNHWSCD